MLGEEREGNVKEREVMPHLPTSGQIMGALVGKLGVKHPLLQSRTARRFFSGDPEQLVKDSTREDIIGAIAEVLTESGFIGARQTGEDNHALSLRCPKRWSGTRITGTSYGPFCAEGR